MSNGRRVVAELGRPETPEETFERKLAASREHRRKQSLNNLIYSLIAIVVVVVIIVFLVPRTDQPTERNVDFRSVAQTADSDGELKLVTPDVPQSWHANRADVQKTSDGIQTWTIGFLAPTDRAAKTTFVGFKQGINANGTWLSDTLDKAKQSGTRSIGGREWQEYTGEQSSTSNTAHALSTTVGESTFVVYGSEQKTVDSLATAVNRSIDKESSQ